MNSILFKNYCIFLLTYLFVLFQYSSSYLNSFYKSNFHIKNFNTHIVKNAGNDETQAIDSSNKYDNDVFYPEIFDIPKTGEVNITNEDDALYQLFLDQISELTKYDNDNINDDIDIYSSKSMKTIKQPVKLVETTSILEKGMPIEFNYKGRVSFGTFVQKKVGSNGIIVNLPYNSTITIDIGQIISCWDMLADETIPSTTLEWSQVVNEALEILGNMSPRKSNLEEFWQLISKRSNSLAVDSIDLGIYIFQEKCFKKWINPYINADESNALALSAAQRYVAALLLHNDDIHFKRRISKFIDNNNNQINIIEGGYTINEAGIILYREGDIFVSYYNNFIKNITNIDTNPFRQICITKQLRALEIYALAPPNLAIPQTIKHLLKRLNKSLKPESAKEILNNLKYKSLDKIKNKLNIISITPWTKEVLDETNELLKEIDDRKIELKEISLIYNKIGKRGLLGKMDYRNDISNHPVISIDSKTASFYDDCFSLSPSTNEILIHIVDVNEFLRKYTNLQQCAKDRLSSTFLPTGPIHMLPPQALEGLKLSVSSPNEVITVAIKINEQTGEILHHRIFPSIIGPVFAIDMDTAEELLNTLDNQINKSEELYQYGYPISLLNDLITTRDLVSKIIDKNEWVDKHFNEGTNRNFKLDKKSGSYKQNIIEKTTINRMINALLTIYSEVASKFCIDKDIPIPIAWENRDRYNNQIIRRFATQPLRNWLSQIQQKQLRSALKLELPLNRKDCAMAVSYHNNKRKEIANYQTKRYELMSYESLESHCLNMYNSGHDNIILNAEGLGIGGKVKLIDFKVNGIVNQDIKKGDKIKVLIKKLIPENKSVILQLIS